MPTGMHPHVALVTRFYDSFADRDGDAMAACYHPEATFSDPVFPHLQGAEVGDMWRMLTQRARDLRVAHRDITADEAVGTAHWEAWYAFSKTKRRVHNVIEARFEFRDGLIWRHTDRFDLWRWSRQALGVPGVLLGWSPLLRRQIRVQAGSGLARWRAEHTAGSPRETF